MIEHIGIIMDGNGRWGLKNRNSRIEGHKKGILSLENCINNCIDLGIKTLTVFAFSTENWKRPQLEVRSIMKLFKDYLVHKKNELNKNNICLNVLGRRENLSKSLLNEIEKTEALLKNNDRLVLNICFNYGGRDEIIYAVNRLIYEGKRIIEENDIDQNIFTKGMKNPDLIIRTGGEYRLSNFLIWQSIYSELYFTDTLWPDFNKEDLIMAIDSFNKRKRRFGGLDAK